MDSTFLKKRMYYAVLIKARALADIANVASAIKIRFQNPTEIARVFKIVPETSVSCILP